MAGTGATGTHAVCAPFEVVPAAQAVQAGVPVFGAMNPFAHIKHCGESCGANVPGGQRGQVNEPAFEKLPGMQTLHEPAPEFGEKVPAEHGMHAVELVFGANVPGLQGVHAVEPGLGAAVPTPHAKQPVAPALG